MQKQLSEGQVINDAYRILAYIGEGGIGVVYRAQQLDLQRIVAIKVLKDEYTESEDWLARFQREGRILASLHHPNIVSCFAAGIWHGRIPFLVFEYLQGISLRELIRNNHSLELSRALELGVQICQALAHAHESNVVHRDLKPENIMLVGDEKNGKTVKVLDFGLAAELAACQGLTKTGMLLGSAGYMSPEQCMGKAADKRSDIYATACIIYECITGLPPHMADTPMGLIYKHATEYPIRIGELKENAPEALDAIILKGMAKDAADRYQSAQEMAADLSKLKDSLAQHVDMSTSQIILNPRVWEASGQAGRRSSSQLKILGGGLVIALITTAAILFLCSDPGIAPLLVFRAGFVPRQERCAYLEKTADQLAGYKHAHAAIILYGQALTYRQNISAKMRLYSKLAAVALSSGRNEDASHFAGDFFNATRDPACTGIEYDSLARVLPVMEKLPVAWNNELYYKLWKFTDAPMEIYPAYYVGRFALTIADCTDGDSQLSRLQNLFMTIISTEFHNDYGRKKHVIAWAQMHLNTFGNYKRLLEPILAREASMPTNASGKGSLLQTVVDVCASADSLDSPERIGMMLVVARTFAFLDMDRKEAFNIDKLGQFLPQRATAAATARATAAATCKAVAETTADSSAYAILVCDLLFAQSLGARSDFAGCIRYAREALRIVAKREDISKDPTNPYQSLRDWAFEAILSSSGVCPVNTAGRFELAQEFIRAVNNSPRLLQQNLSKAMIQDLLNITSSVHRYDEAEIVIKECLNEASLTPRNRVFYSIWYSLADLYLMEKNFQAAKTLLLKADADIRASGASAEISYPVMDAWSRYYQLGEDDPAKSRECLLKGFQGAKLAGDSNDIAFHEFWLHELESHAKK